MKSPKLAVLLPAAQDDVDDIVTYYRQEGGAELAWRWIEAFEAALLHIGTHPGTGSLRYAELLDLENLRFWQLARFPHLVFYVEQAEHVDVWRVLHGRRDIPASLNEGRER